MHCDMLDLLWPFGMQLLAGGVTWVTGFLLLMLLRIMQVHCPNFQNMEEIVSFTSCSSKCVIRDVTTLRRNV